MNENDWAYYEQRIEVGDCWTWAGTISGGYPRAGGGRGWAHREVWKLLVGPIPRGYEMDQPPGWYLIDVDTLELSEAEDREVAYVIPARLIEGEE